MEEICLERNKIHVTATVVVVVAVVVVIIIRCLGEMRRINVVN